MSRGPGRFQQDLIAELEVYPWSGLPEIAARWTDNPYGLVYRPEYEQLRRAMWSLHKRDIVRYRWVEEDGYRFREWALTPATAAALKQETPA
jgi:hypothetical protein